MIKYKKCAKDKLETLFQSDDWEDKIITMSLLSKVENWQIYNNLTKKVNLIKSRESLIEKAIKFFKNKSREPKDFSNEIVFSYPLGDTPLVRLMKDNYWKFHRIVSLNRRDFIKISNEFGWRVRREVVRKGYLLDILFYEGDADVRAAVARQGYRINELIFDDWEVRIEIARQGYGLCFLIEDENWEVRAAVARKGYRLDILVNDKDWRVRREVARQGYGLNILVKDKKWQVRREVARQGYGLDILVDDSDEDVRAEVARKGYGLDILVKDRIAKVREEVARQEFGLNILIKDKDWIVREEVALQGYGLDVLENDPDEDVRNAVKKYIQQKEIKKKELQLRIKYNNLI